MSKQDKLDNYNPSGVGLDNGHIFGLPFEFEDAEIVILPVPWELTTSFGGGTSQGPQAILNASPQLDLYHLDYPDAWKQGIYMLDISKEILQLNNRWQAKANELILLQEKGKTVQDLKAELQQINEVCDEMRKWVFEQCTTLMNRGKKVVLLGGDHSTPLGYIQALAQKHESFGILQIDAHADLRVAYEGFAYSHASVMYNALDSEAVSALVQVGIRDICQEEVDYIKSDSRVRSYFDGRIKQRLYEGIPLKEQWQSVISDLPEKVYVSFDIDGLDPKLCPNTGTPVPGGLEFQEATELLRMLKESGKEIIGCDLNEVGNNDWDANVGARMLYQLCCII